jgi:hypothetical protein
MASSDHRVSFAFAYKVCCHKDGRAFPLPECLRRVLIHANHIWPMNDPSVGGEAATGDLQNECLIANKDQLIGGVLFCPGDPARNNFRCTVIAPHCIKCKADAA